MKNDRTNYVLVGGFVLAMLVGLIAILAILTGRTGATDSYYAVFDNVTGLAAGTEVLHEGYGVGQIERVVPLRENDRQRFRVEFGVEKGWVIPADSKVAITAPGLLAAFTLEVQGGESATAIPVGGEVPADNAPGLLNQLSDVATDLSSLAEDSLRPVLVSLQERAPLILENVDAITQQLAAASKRIESILSEDGDVQGILDNLSSTTKSVDALARDLDSTQKSVDQLLMAVNDALGDNRGSVDQAVIDLQHSLETVSRHIDAITQNLEGTSRNLYEFSRQVRQNPGVLLNGGQPAADEVGDN